MNTKIFTFVDAKPESKTPSNVIARLLSKRLDAPLAHDTRIIPTKGERLDLLVIVNGAYAFCGHLPALAKAVRVAKRVIWVQNDYTIVMPKHTSQGVSPFRAAFRIRAERGLPPMDVWTTIPDFTSNTPASHYVNWNAVMFNPLPKAKRSYMKTGALNDTLVYYGYFRIGREEYFRRYFNRSRVPVVLRTPSHRKFNKLFPQGFKQRNGVSVTIEEGLPPGQFRTTLAKYGAGMYLEDKRSHKQHHSPACRFYEMLSAGLPMFFQPEAVDQMAVAGYDVVPFVAENTKHIADMMQTRQMIGREQFAMWGECDHRAIVMKQIDKAWKRFTTKPAGAY